MVAEDDSGVLLVEADAETAADDDGGTIDEETIDEGATDEGAADEGVAEEGTADKVVDVGLQPPPRFLCLLAFKTGEFAAVTVVEAVKTLVVV